MKTSTEVQNVIDSFSKWYDVEGRELFGWDIPDCQLAAVSVGYELHLLGRSVEVIAGEARGSDFPAEAGTHFWLVVDGACVDPKEEVLRRLDPEFHYFDRKPDPEAWEVFGAARDTDGGLCFHEYLTRGA